MTAGSSRKKLVRDIQTRSGWSYMFCIRVVSHFGYEVVSKEIDVSKDLAELGGRFHREMKTSAQAAAAQRRVG